MSSGQSGWLFLFVLSIIFIVIGVQGNLGVTFAILFVPEKVVIQ
jgi:hypothetical protein